MWMFNLLVAYLLISASVIGFGIVYVTSYATLMDHVIELFISTVGFITGIARMYTLSTEDVSY